MDVRFKEKPFVFLYSIGELNKMFTCFGLFSQQIYIYVKIEKQRQFHHMKIYIIFS